MTWLLAYVFLSLHGPGGQEIDVNPLEITSVREPQEGSEGHFPKGTRCILKMTNGTSNFVVESCPEVRRLVEERLK